MNTKVNDSPSKTVDYLSKHHLTYSTVPNRRLCTFIFFRTFSPLIDSEKKSGLNANEFLKQFPFCMLIWNSFLFGTLE